MASVGDFTNWLNDTGFHAVYAESLREPLFTGLLVLAGFVVIGGGLAAVFLKQHVFGTEWYFRRVTAFRCMNTSLAQYAPLIRLSNLLLYVAATALAASIFQLTIGFIESNAAAAICVQSAVVALGMAAFSVVMVWQNLLQWLEESEQQDERRREAVEEQCLTER